MQLGRKKGGRRGLQAAGGREGQGAPPAWPGPARTAACCLPSRGPPWPCCRVQAWAKANSVPGDLAELCHSEPVKRMLLAELNATAKAGKLKASGRPARPAGPSLPLS